MTRLLITLVIVLALFAVGYALGKRRVPVSPCPEYKVYGEREVEEWETLAKTRRLSK